MAVTREGVIIMDFQMRRERRQAVERWPLCLPSYEAVIGGGNRRGGVVSALLTWSGINGLAEGNLSSRGTNVEEGK